MPTQPSNDCMEVQNRKTRSAWLFMRSTNWLFLQFTNYDTNSPVLDWWNTNAFERFLKLNPKCVWCTWATIKSARIWFSIRRNFCDYRNRILVCTTRLHCCRQFLPGEKLTAVKHVQPLLKVCSFWMRVWHLLSLHLLSLTCWGAPGQWKIFKNVGPVLTERIGRQALVRK